MFAGHAAYRFKQDPFYSNNFTPTVKILNWSTACRS
jgi:nitronate monooxygenase